MAKQIVIDQNKCKGCSICTKFCPVKCLIMGKKINKSGYSVVEQLPDVKCIGCSMCCKMCPDRALSVVEKGEKK